MQVLPDTDTIAAIATARGQAALAIVRLSGPEAVVIADRCLPGCDLAGAESHTAHVGYFESGEGVRLDQVVATVFRAPRSATGEDVVEVSCHGGDVAPQLVLRALLDGGARLARPGEFTERAFLNGKLDLAQAEAVAELIHAKSTLAHRVALGHLEGRYSAALSEIREELLGLCALVELELDFTEEDVEFADRTQLLEAIDRAEALLDRLLGSYRLGAFVRDGVRVVIAGRPNAGKSTLLNALVGYDRAIVSGTPGTTRDEIEAEVEIAGVAFRFVDTAGLREAEDEIEAEGVRRATHAATHADLLLYVFDLQAGLYPDEREWLRRFASPSPPPACFTVKQDDAELSGAQPSSVPLLLIGNKADLASPDSEAVTSAAAYLPLSARDATVAPELLNPLRVRLASVVFEKAADASASLIVLNQRHYQHLSHARRALSASRASLAKRSSPDVVAHDLRLALDELGGVTGEVTRDDVLGAIFARFCIGK